jgi:3-hydroxyisobutyrate dehydrogenase-like beta-hydroxyacid dehydrogenase
MAEAFAFAEGQEADLRLLFQVLRTGSANSNMLESQVPDFLAEEYKPRFIMKLAKKDLDLVTGFANQLGLPLPLSTYMKEVFQIGMRWKLGERNESAIFEVWRQFMGHS